MKKSGDENKGNNQLSNIVLTVVQNSSSWLGEIHNPTGNVDEWNTLLPT